MTIEAPPATVPYGSPATTILDDPPPAVPYGSPPPRGPGGWGGSRESAPGILYLVTVSDQYYPCAGTRDWRALTSDLDEARNEYNRAARGSTDASVFLVALEPATETYRVVDSCSV